MKDTLKPGLKYQFKYKIPENKTVPHLYPEAEELQLMPKVFATGFMIGLLEWTCIQAMEPHIDWPNEQSVGISINVNHTAATPQGFTVTVNVELLKLEGKKLTFKVEAYDDIEKISEGTHERYIINAEKFNKSVEEKKKKI